MTYYYEDEGIMPDRKKKNDYERLLTNLFVKQMTKEGAICHRFKDAGYKNPFDMYLYHNQVWMPIEWKLKIGGQTFNVDAWRERQPHQYDNLVKACKQGARAMLGIFWIPLHGTPSSAEWRVMRVEMLPNKVPKSNMCMVTNLKELMEA